VVRNCCNLATPLGLRPISDAPARTQRVYILRPLSVSPVSYTGHDANPASERAVLAVNVCVVSFKECWQDQTGRWVSTGGFPLQMAGVGSLFDELTLVIVRGQPTAGGIPLPAGARVVPLPRPVGEDARRKLSVVARSPYYLGVIGREILRADVV